MFWHDSGNDDMDLSSSNRNQTNAEGMLKQGAAAVVILTDPRWEQSAEQGAERSTAGKHKPANKTHSRTATPLSMKWHHQNQTPQPWHVCLTDLADVFEGRQIDS